MMDTKWSSFTVRIFELFFQPWMRWRLGGICLTGLPRALPDDHTVVLAANHTSWWDAFLLREIHRGCAPYIPLITLMQEEELQRFPFFRWMGVTGIGGSVASTRDALRCLERFRRCGPFWMSIFPQGSIQPSWHRPMEFQRGIGLFVREVGPAVILPVGIHLEMLKYPGPTAFVAIGEPLGGRDLSPQRLEERVSVQLDTIFGHLARHGEDAAERWPPDAAEGWGADEIRGANSSILHHE